MPATKTTMRHKSTFPAWDESGLEQTLHVYVDTPDDGHTGAPHAEAEGLPNLRTEEGYHVNYLEKGKYQVVATGEILTSNHPAAP
jgi:hypothetical protein